MSQRGLGDQGHSEHVGWRESPAPSRSSSWSIAGLFACVRFVESAARALLDNGVEPDRIRTERFGPTGCERDGSKDLFVHQSAANVGAV